MTKSRILLMLWFAAPRRETGRRAAPVEGPPGPWWPPHNCYQVDAEIVDDIVCQNSCSNCSLEICEDLQTGQQWWHIPIRRPHEFVECTGREYSTCGGGDDGDLPID
ncbi:MAG: hypothetical protein IPK74_06265 [Deltaproteobacteria bacterium]|nr:hypothetical protein [Deltaproteobacteria bacterium]